MDVSSLNLLDEAFTTCRLEIESSHKKTSNDLQVKGKGFSPSKC